MSAQKSRPTGVLGAVLGLVGFSVIAGVLVTAMVTPALAVGSMTAKGGIGIFENLPDFITLGAQSQQNQIYANRDGKAVLIATTYKQNRIEVKSDQVSDFLKNAVVAGEDRRFYDHGGVDISSVVRASLGNALSGNVQSGSSTLDMQLVKNILIQEALQLPTAKEQEAGVAAAQKTSLDRKLKEMKLAIGLDKRYTKSEILLGYLNIAGFGGNTYGVEAAAQEYFSVSAKDVTVAQAASLIAIVQQPGARDLKVPAHYAANKARRDIILNNMYQLKYIDKKQYDTAMATTIEQEIKRSNPTSGCRNASDAPLVCDYVTKLITASPAAGTPGLPPQLLSLGATPTERKANWDTGGYKIYTSIDLSLQDVAQEQLGINAPADENRFQLGATANSVEVGTGRVLVMAQNKVFDDALDAAKDSSKTAVNYTTDFNYGGSKGFPTGSTYKVIDLVNWLQTGHGLNDLVDGTSPQTYKFSSFTAPCDPGALGGGTFNLKNDSGSGSVMTVKEALIGSVNNSFMQMAERQDLCSIRDTAIAMGAHRADGAPLSVNPNAILGANEQAPLTMAGVAASVGSSGLHCDAILVDKVVDPSGKELPGQTKTCNQAMTTDVAAGALNAMVGSMTGGTSSPGNPRDGTPIAGKTGTSDVADHVWIIGTTTKIATSVWTGNIVGHQSLRALSNPQTGQNYASNARFNVFKAIMKEADNRYHGDAFPAASEAVLGGASSTVPSLVGQTPEQAKAILESLHYIYNDGGTEASSLPAGKVSRTDPDEGTKTPTGATVTVFTSDGTLATTMPNVTSPSLSRQAADAAIVAKGFSQSKISYTWIASANPGEVCKVSAQNPAAGAAAAKTDPVTLTVHGLMVAPTGGNYDPGTTTCPL